MLVATGSIIFIAIFYCYINTGRLYSINNKLSSCCLIAHTDLLATNFLRDDRNIVQSIENSCTDFNQEYLEYFSEINPKLLNQINTRRIIYVATNSTTDLLPPSFILKIKQIEEN